MFEDSMEFVELFIEETNTQNNKGESASSLGKNTRLL